MIGAEFDASESFCFSLMFVINVTTTSLEFLMSHVCFRSDSAQSHLTLLQNISPKTQKLFEPKKNPSIKREKISSVKISMIIKFMKQSRSIVIDERIKPPTTKAHLKILIKP